MEFLLVRDREFVLWRLLTSVGRWSSPANTPSCGCKRNVMLSNLKFDPSIGIQVNYSFLAILDYGETWSVLVCYIRTIFLTSKTICLRIEKLEECHCARRCDRAVRWSWWRICLSAVYEKHDEILSTRCVLIYLFHQCNAFFTLQIVYINTVYKVNHPYLACLSYLKDRKRGRGKKEFIQIIGPNACTKSFKYTFESNRNCFNKI